MKRRGILDSKGKKAQGSIMGMPFTMLFSILLIIFFIAAAFIAIKFFLNFQKNANVGLFINNLQVNVDDTWRSHSASDFDFNTTLPSSIDYVCFVDLNRSLSRADPVEEVIYEDIFDGNWYAGANLILYPLEAVGDFTFNTIDHIQVPDDNPHCIKVEDGKIRIRIYKEFGDSFVSVE